MQIRPLVLHAAQRLPTLTSLFSDALDVSTIDVATGGDVTLNTATAHGITIGEQIAVCITDAETPNPITGATVDVDGNIVITTQFDHDFTTTPDPFRAKPWDTTAKVTGFTDPLINGTRDLFEAPDARTFVLGPGGEVLSVVLNSNEVVLKTLEREIVGWHAVTAATTTTLTFPTPAAITRSYTVAAPDVVRNIRIFGSLNDESVIGQFVRDDGTALPADKAWMFITPIPVKASRSGTSKTDSLADISENVDFRMLLRDGFKIYVVLPSEEASGGINAIDKAEGPILRAVLGTFLGLKLTRPELCAGGSYVAIIEGHGAAGFTNANYMHGYEFFANAYLTNADAVPPFDIADISPAVINDPDTVPDTIIPIGAPVFRDIDFTGILHDGFPQPLTATIEMDD